VGHEIGVELASADRVDLLCSFLLWSGYTRLETALKQFLDRPATRLRVLTTVYLGATEQRVVEALCKIGAEVKISYETQRTRLHAKAWLIHRDSGYNTAFVGSSNLSASALTDGLEWNVRIGQDAPFVLEKFASAFETYWNDKTFEPYDPTSHRDKLAEALGRQRAVRSTTLTNFEIRPRPFQEAILEALDAERFTHGRRRNLIVAATGTGKTVVAALDFKSLAARFKSEHGRAPSLLFLAHRKELLTQARDTFRIVLRDTQFGHRMVDGERPANSDQLFASVQSLSNVHIESVSPTRWDIVIVDEFHHAEAASYDRWLRHLDPWILLGLTATPERGDGIDIRHWFGGRTAAELRLWDAIEQNLLVPFQYFALKDPLDLSTYWRRGQLDLSHLDKVLTSHHIRAAAVVEALGDTVADVQRMRAIGFCVGQGHARFMADFFNARGIKSATALGGDAEREAKVRELRSGDLRVLFTVDALSEGVDVPELDTALFLRPTESPTVFLQQLGRGLRLCEGKRCLTVIDFIATPDREFRMDRKYTALLGESRRQLKVQVEQGFPLLPPGCSIQLTPDAKDLLLENLRTALSSNRRDLVAELKRMRPAPSLEQFLDHTGLALGELYKGRCFTELKREAGLVSDPAGPKEQFLGRGLARLSTLDDPLLLRKVISDLAHASPPKPSIEWKIILATLLPDLALSAPEEGLRTLWDHPSILGELAELCSLLETRGAYVPLEFENSANGIHIHCHYKLDQLMCGLTGNVRRSYSRPREGVVYIEEHRFDVLLITLNKAIERYSPSTMYKDYAISRELFHWQSQSTTTQISERGKRNLLHMELGITPLIFVRPNPEDEFGETAPYMFLGPADCEAFEGERPINVTWRLRIPMPAGLFERTRVVA
jgi:superfamily II DNA or RNA helicase/HKD family nuclease